MNVHFYITRSTPRLKKLLDELQLQNAIDHYEIHEGRRQVKFQPFNAQSILKIGVLLGQLEEVNKGFIAAFNHHKGKIHTG